MRFEEPLAPLLVTSGGYHWRHVQTCSLDLTVQPPLPQEQHLAAIEGVMVHSHLRFSQLLHEP